MSSFLDTQHTLLGVKEERQSPPRAALLSLLQRLTFTMRIELPVLSFVSIALLILILPGQVHTFSIPSVSIIAWFFLCNLIHGINAILWSGNQNVQAPLWCDICEIFAHCSDCVLISPLASVVLLGAMVALPGCFLCISRRLEAITSIHMVDQKRGKTFDRSFEAVVCFLFPALYMSLRA
jgi:Pheromone A receptor